MTPRRRCSYLDNHGQQCDNWFPAVDSSKLCPAHEGILVNNGRLNEQETPRYIDLVNDQREYCYHFKDGSAQNQTQTLIFEYKDDQDGTKHEKLDAHIAFIEKVIEDLKARYQSSRAVKLEALDALSEAERKELRKIKIDKEIKRKEKEKIPSIK